MVKIDIRKASHCNGENALFMSFPYNDTIISYIRQLPSRYWYKESKEWEVPADKLSFMLEALNHMGDVDVSISGLNLLVEENKPISSLADTFNFKTTPFEHQKVGFNYGMTKTKWLLGDEQGLGKTKQIIDIAVAKKQTEGYKHCLIVCGVNGLKWNWQNEIHTHSNEECIILGQRVRKNGKVYIGSNSDKIDDLYKINDNSPYFIITNVESLRDSGIIEILKILCNNGTISMIAVDEIHKCKNPSSQQGKGLLKLHSDYMVAMSGTPLLNTPLDLFIVLKWLGYEKHAFYQFKMHHCIMGGFGGYEVIGYKNIDELQDTLNKIMLRRRKEDVLDLPEKIYIDEFVEMTPKQEQVYRDVSNDIKANIDKIKMANNPLAELIRMRQATGYTGILSSVIQESAKLDRVEELLEESIDNGRKVVIYSNWVQIVNPTYERLRERFNGVKLTGEDSELYRQESVHDFQENDKCKFIIGTIGAMGTGITLTAGTVVIFLDEPWTMANKQQAIDRCHRIGTTSKITIYTIMCKNTIDERIHEIVERKGAISDALVDGKIVGNKTELLNFLLS